jgi:hypothetical protein
MLGYKDEALLERISASLVKNQSTLNKLDVTNSFKALAYFDYIRPITQEALLNTVISNGKLYDFASLADIC